MILVKSFPTKNLCYQLHHPHLTIKKKNSIIQNSVIQKVDKDEIYVFKVEKGLRNDVRKKQVNYVFYQIMHIHVPYL